MGVGFMYFYIYTHFIHMYLHYSVYRQWLYQSHRNFSLFDIFTLTSSLLKFKGGNQIEKTMLPNPFVMDNITQKGSLGVIGKKKYTLGLPYLYSEQ